MKSKTIKEIKETLKKIEQVAGFIGDYGNDEEQGHERVEYTYTVSDVVNWILDDRISNDDFLSEDYIDIPLLEKMAKDIEDRTGENFEDYKKKLEQPIKLDPRLFTVKA